MATATLRRALMGLLWCVALVGSTRPSEACSDSDYVGKVVGVARDGSFLYHWQVLRSGGDARGGVTLLDSSGAVLVEDVILDPQGWEAVAETHPRLRAIEPWSYFEREDALVQRLAAAMGLSPLEPAGIHAAATNRSPDRWTEPCARVEAYAAGSGSVIELLSEDMRRCHHTRVRLLRHPHSPLWFLSYRDGSRQAEVCYSYVENTSWLPRHRLRAAAMGAMAQRIAARRPRRAARMLHEALKLDPGHAVIRRMLADTLPRTGITWPQARELLSVPWPEHMCVDDLSFPARDSAAAFRRLAGFEQVDHDRWVEHTREAADRCRFGYRWWHW